MSLSLLSGFILFLPLAILFILLAVALVFIGFILYKKGNRTLAVVLWVVDLFPIGLSLVFFVTLIVAVLESFGIM